MNPHMTESDWLQYIQTFEPATEGEAIQYLKDLKGFAKTGNISAGLAESRAKRTSCIWPILKTQPEFNQIVHTSNEHQYNIQAGFLRN
jgi:hypothetical protein